MLNFCMTPKLRLLTRSAALGLLGPLLLFHCQLLLSEINVVSNNPVVLSLSGQLTNRIWNSVKILSALVWNMLNWSQRIFAHHNSYIVMTCAKFCCDQLNMLMLWRRALQIFIWFPIHDDIIKLKHFPHYWPFMQGIHQSPVNSPHKGQWRRALMFSLICTLNKRSSKQSWGWWFETPSRSLWCHCNVIEKYC